MKDRYVSDYDDDGGFDNEVDISMALRRMKSTFLCSAISFGAGFLFACLLVR